MDAGPHSKTCADAVSGVCHCDCHGAQHGIKFSRGLDRHGPDVTISRRSSGGGFQVARADGLPPGGGTREERVERHAQAVTVASNRPADVADVAPAEPAAAPTPAMNAADRQRVRNAVEDHAAQYHGGPMRLDRADAARYVTEGHLHDVAARNGFGATWEEAARVINERPDVLERDNGARADARTAASRDANVRAAAALRDGNGAEARRIIDEAAAADPDYQAGGRSWDDLRAIVDRRTGPDPGAPATPAAPEYSRQQQRLVDFADAMERHAERGNNPFGPRVDTLAEYNRIHGYPREHYDALTPEDRARVAAALDAAHTSNRNSADVQNRIGETIERLTDRPVPRATTPPPRHVQEVLDAQEGRRRGTTLPASMAYAQINRDQYEQHFSPEQRARAVSQLREIRSGMRDDAPDRPGVDRVIRDLESIDRPAQVEVRTNPQAERVAAAEHELTEARAALAGLDGTPGTSSMRGKQHGQRVDANVRRAAQLADRVQRAERALAAAREQGDRPTSTPAAVTPERLANAKFVKTRYGWYEVVKVNKSSVKVRAAPGMDDRIPIGRITEVR